MNSFKHIQCVGRKRNIVIHYMNYKFASTNLVQVSSKFVQRPNESIFQRQLRRRVALPISRYLIISLKKRDITLNVKINFYDVNRISTPEKRQGVGSSYTNIVRQLTKLLLHSWIQLNNNKTLIHIMEVATVDTKDLVLDFSPPSSVKGMKVLDRNAFKKDVNVAGIVVPLTLSQELMKLLRKYLIKGRHTRKMYTLKEDDPLSLTHKMMLFEPSKVKSLDDLPDNLKEELTELGVDLKTFCFYNLELQYDNWGFEEILGAILPDTVTEKVGGFALIGHIAHLNLKEELLPFKNLIGQVILDKVPQVKTVVNKLSTIDNTYRNFEMEILAGEDNTVASVREHGCTFTFDYSKVYWNSKLSTEHQRIVERVSPGDIVYDVFAGVGPFAIPAAKKGAHVFANDLNPDSYCSLMDNCKANKKKKGTILCFNEDGRDFIRTIVKNDILKQWQAMKKTNSDTGNAKLHIVMNLPAIAIEFLDAFMDLFKEEEILPLPKEWWPHVYCYCFSTEEDYVKDVVTRIEGIIKEPLPKDYVVRRVRNVAPNKEMLCVSFQLSDHLLLGERKQDEGPTEKKMRLEEEC